MNLRRISNWLFNLDAHYPRTIIAGVIFITVILGWKVFDLELDPSVRSMLPRDHSIVESIEKIDELFSGSDIIIIAAESDSLLTRPETLKKLSSFQDSLESISLISRVTSIYTQKHIISSEDGFKIEPLLIDIPIDSSDYNSFIEKLHRAGVVENLISKDYNTICFIGQINSSFEFDEFEFRKTIYELVDHFSTPEKFYVSSLPITQATIIDNMQRDMRVFTL